MATHQWCWLQCPKDEAYPSHSSKWLFSERGARTSNYVSQRLSAEWLWIRSWRARPNSRTHWRLSAANSAWASENQNLGSQLASDYAHCPDSRKRPPRGWLTRRWPKPLTRLAPVHLLFDPMLKFLDDNCCCSNPTLANRLSGRCVCPTCEETPALRRRLPQTPPYTSRVTLPTWFSETKSGDTSHSVWWTKTSNKLDANWLRRKYGANLNTNQDLVAWPGNIHVDTDSRQSKLRPELVHQFIPSAQTQHFNEGGNFRRNPRFGSAAPLSSTTTFSEKRYSLSLTTIGALITFSRCRSTSAGLMAFPS